MSALWTYTEAAKATNGQAVGVWSAKGVSIDTRTLDAGDLFVPLKDTRDGHDFIPRALEKGAIVMSRRPIRDVPALRVNDSMKALQDLGQVARQRCEAKRIAVTGSVGKTTVKEMIAHICRAFGKTHASEKSYNNHWGVPLTLARMPRDTEYAVFELGMNHAGEISELTRQVRPDIAIITRVAAAHLEFFYSVEDIAKAKAEIFEGLDKNGTGIFYSQSEYADLFMHKIPGNVRTFGQDNADVTELHCEHTRAGMRAVFKIGRGPGAQPIELSLPFPGAHWIYNVGCVLLVAHSLGLDVTKAARSLQTLPAIAGRGEQHRLEIDGKSILLIDESYNANPESMRNALLALGAASGRKIAVLGDMLELGKDENRLHAELSEHIKAADVDRVFTCGKRMRALDEKLSSVHRGPWTDNHGDALEALLSEMCDGDIIMIKGSNASDMGKMVTALKTYGQGENADVI